MAFKVDWEKADSQHVLPTDIIHKMVAIAYPNKQVRTHQIISGGCANVNVKLWFQEDEFPLILRIYLRDKTSAYREQKIAELLHEKIPVPHIYYIGSTDGYCFAIAEFMPGSSLRELLLNNKTCNISSIMQSVGIILSKITYHEFPKAGFFDQDLKVVKSIDRDGYISFAKECLQDAVVISQLAPKTRAQINHYLDIYGYLFPDKNEKHLVHADFDPANILVDNVDNTWKVSGILDWEFSFSGSVLCDVANMLRYAHQMPSNFQSAFLEGLKSCGITLPENWRITVHMLNILSLLDCLKRSNSHNRPNQCADIRELIRYILLELAKK